jgi:uncharacterized protein (DUF934 family)
MKIIHRRAIVDDEFLPLSDDAPLPREGSVLVSLARWQAEGPALAEGRAVGVRVPSSALPSDIPHLDRLALVAIEFPRFSDGRGYSVGRMLRQRHGFRGQLRAVGWVLRDNLLYLERVGFDAFELREGKPLESALEAFDELAVAYQATAADPRPLYRRR